MTDAFHTLIPLKSRRFADSEKIRSSANRHLVHPSKEVHIDRTQRFAYRSRFVHDFREFSMRSDFWSSFHAVQGRMHAMIRSHIDRCIRPLRFLVHLIRHSEKTLAARNSNLFRKACNCDPISEPTCRSSSTTPFSVGFPNDARIERTLLAGSLQTVIFTIIEYVNVLIFIIYVVVSVTIIADSHRRNSQIPKYGAMHFDLHRLMPLSSTPVIPFGLVHSTPIHRLS